MYFRKIHGCWKVLNQQLFFFKYQWKYLWRYNIYGDEFVNKSPIDLKIHWGEENTILLSTISFMQKENFRRKQKNKTINWVERCEQCWMWVRTILFVTDLFMSLWKFKSLQTLFLYLKKQHFGPHILKGGLNVYL